MTWNPERTRRLTELWENGETANRIAAIMGTSRNAVLGKALRLGLSRRPSPLGENKKFERLIDLIADNPDEEISVRKAAYLVGLNPYAAERMWDDFIHSVAFHPEIGAEIYP